jgi:putative ABC transport system permease protein
MNERTFQNFQIALEAIRANKFRAMLTALGIIFGVAAVIAMLAIGNGARQEILEQIKLVGVNNIVITPLKEQKEGKADGKTKENEQKRFSPGLNLKDAEGIQEVLTCVDKVSPEIVYETDFVYGGLRRSGKLVGTDPSYFDMTNFSLYEGAMFNSRQSRYGEQVCLIGKGIMTKFFSKEDPLGKYIKCGREWLKVTGVLNERLISTGSASSLGIRDYNMDIYVPIKTMLVRFTNRSLVTKTNIEAAQADDNNDEDPSKKTRNLAQLDRLVIRVNASEAMQPAAEIISRLMSRRHNGVTDYEIAIPELLLKQQQRTKDIFNLVLGFIAGISLLVGGIGIMNIMLASVLERIKEIGIRLSIGATKKDIEQQFVFEAVLISIAGGFAGVLLGIVFSYLVSGFAGISTIVSGWSIALSFAVAATTGLVFGITPARRAADKDPINALRHE